MTSDKLIPDPWPALPYSDFTETRHLLHMIVQIVGKLKLNEPFQAQWAGIPLWVNARGLTTGQFPVRAAPMRCVSISSPIRWNGIPAPGSAGRWRLTRARWRILLSIRRVFYAFQGRFTGKTQPIGLMWGMLDIRHVVYNGHPETPSPKDGYIDRNAMTEGMTEMGWWTGDASHPEPAFFAFTFPHPRGIETAKIAPDAAGWVPAMGEFLLDYEALCQSKDPDAALSSFLESTYQAGAKAAGWDPALLGSGKPN